MSRYSTPTSGLDKLAIAGSSASTSSSSDMPTITRGMRQRAQEQPASSQRPTSAAEPSSSSSGGRPRRSARGAPARDTGEAARRSGRLAPYPAPAPPPADDDAAGDGDGSDDGDSPDEEEQGPEQPGPEHPVIEMFAALADSFPTPAEFAAIDPNSLNNQDLTRQT